MAGLITLLTISLSGLMYVTPDTSRLRRPVKSGY